MAAKRRPLVLIITDSVGAPRRRPTLSLFRETWVGILQERFLEGGIAVFPFTERALDTTKLVHRTELQLSLYEPQLVVLQVGISDCANRLLTEREKQILQWLVSSPGARRFGVARAATWFVERNRSRFAARGLRETAPSTFRSNLLRFKEYFPDVPMIVVPIAPVNAAAQAMDSRLAATIADYNAILAELFADAPCQLLHSFSASATASIDTLYMNDNFHFTANGHRLLARQIAAAAELHLGPLATARASTLAEPAPDSALPPPQRSFGAR